MNKKIIMIIIVLKMLNPIGLETSLNAMDSISWDESGLFDPDQILSLSMERVSSADGRSFNPLDHRVQYQTLPPENFRNQNLQERINHYPSPLVLSTHQLPRRGSSVSSYQRNCNPQENFHLSPDSPMQVSPSDDPFSQNMCSIPPTHPVKYFRINNSSCDHYKQLFHNTINSLMNAAVNDFRNAQFISDNIWNPFWGNYLQYKEEDLKKMQTPSSFSSSALLMDYILRSVKINPESIIIARNNSQASIFSVLIDGNEFVIVFNQNKINELESYSQVEGFSLYAATILKSCIPRLIHEIRKTFSFGENQQFDTNLHILESSLNRAIFLRAACNSSYAAFRFAPIVEKILIGQERALFEKIFHMWKFVN